MNLWVSMEDEGARTSDENAFNRSLAPLATHLAALGAPRPYKPYSPARFEDQARVLLDAKVPAFSFSYGIPPREILEECRAKSCHDWYGDNTRRGCSTSEPGEDMRCRSEPPSTPFAPVRSDPHRLSTSRLRLKMVGDLNLEGCAHRS
jgi:hypothetical protein